MSFGSVQVIPNCNGTNDVMYNGMFDREIDDLGELRITEELSLVRDQICMFLSNFPGNIITGILDISPNELKRRNNILRFFENKHSIDYLKSVFFESTVNKIEELYNEFDAFFDDIPKLLDPAPADSCITDSGIIFTDDGGFEIFRISQGGIKKITFTKSELSEILGHG